MPKENSQITPYPLRLPPKLRAELEESARKNGRSLNVEITKRLEQSHEGNENYLTLDELRKELDNRGL